MSIFYHIAEYFFCDKEYNFTRQLPSFGKLLSVIMTILNSTVEECTLKLQRIKRDPGLRSRNASGGYSAGFSSAFQ